MKLCKECGLAAPFTGTRQRGVCNACRARQERERRQVNGDSIRASERARYRANPGPRKAVSRARQASLRATKPEILKAEIYRHKAGPMSEEAVEYLGILANDPCSYCGQPSSQVDHIDPIYTGGDNSWTNLTAACAPCNASKRDRALIAHLLAFRLRLVQREMEAQQALLRPAA